MRNIFRKKKKTFPKVFAFMLLVIALNILLLTDGVYANELDNQNKQLNVACKIADDVCHR
ncbi:hypothetical protein [Thalassomonas sp. M1454]|uniref:hypothetical protein n=1 Tax=Thalassomonas sp. M1454 TaxID=2594477 RepID=UPI0011815DAB|nr:hypothetical protein [Thalassomonas sp. M1454]TRX54962.1 hypothetical protein FNN08_10180 [Thalassomonas sp. M1454]